MRTRTWHRDMVSVDTQVRVYDIFEVACTYGSDLALKWFNADGGDPEPYEGGRELMDLATL